MKLAYGAAGAYGGARASRFVECVMAVQVEGYRNESFESVEAAVMETPRGRWFLEEFARRQRSAETLAILEILKKLENAITHPAAMAAPQAAVPHQPLRAEQLKFFKQDEEMFVEPAIAAPTLSVVSTTAGAGMASPADSKAAKLTVQHLTRDGRAVSAESEKPLVTAPAASLAPQPPVEPKQRVIIIRRPASEAAEIPLMEEDGSEAAA